MKLPSSCLVTTSTCQMRRQFSRPWCCGWGMTCKTDRRTWGCSSPTSDCPCCHPRYGHEGPAGSSASWNACLEHPVGREESFVERFWFGLEVIGIFFTLFIFFYICSLFLNTDGKKSLSASVITRLRITSKNVSLFQKPSVPSLGCNSSLLTAQKFRYHAKIFP